MMLTCPLCQSGSPSFFIKDKKQSYFKCADCLLIFVDKSDQVSPEYEKERYDYHNNSEDDEAYVNTFRSLISRLELDMSAGSKGLDFGSGPTPVLASILKKKGYEVALYDLFYANDPVVFEKTYDFITATEVFEHLAKPLEEIERLWACLKPGGSLYIQTLLYPVKEKFVCWHYKNDVTHISFFCEEAFKYVSEVLSAELEVIGKNFIILRKAMRAE